MQPLDWRSSLRAPTLVGEPDAFAGDDDSLSRGEAWVLCRAGPLPTSGALAQRSATETRASNLKGHELRFAYAFEKNINLVARLFLVEAITTAEDGNRFRVDLNFKF